jgi:hypothetical protein
MFWTSGEYCPRGRNRQFCWSSRFHFDLNASEADPQFGRGGGGAAYWNKSCGDYATAPGSHARTLRISSIIPSGATPFSSLVFFPPRHSNLWLARERSPQTTEGHRCEHPTRRGLSVQCSVLRFLFTRGSHAKYWPRAGGQPSQPGSAVLRSRGGRSESRGRRVLTGPETAVFGG